MLLGWVMSEKLRTLPFIIKFIAFVAAFAACAALLILAASRIGTSDVFPVSVPPRRTVVVDPGHGGRDGGAVGIGGSVEKEIDLEITKRLAQLLALCGENTVMTRTGDEMLSLPGTTGNLKGRDIRSRIKIADGIENALLVSIHVNSYPVEKYRGMQVFYSPECEEGRAAALSVQNVCREYLQPENERKIKEAPASVYLLNHVKTPAILVECGFISNAEEESLLQDPAYRVKVAAVICSGILSHESEVR